MLKKLGTGVTKDLAFLKELKERLRLVYVTVSLLKSQGYQ